MYIHRLVFLLILTIFLLSPAIMEWWLGPRSAWYRPYLIWAGVILIAYWLERKTRLK